MGFFGKLIDDVLDIPAKVIEAPFKTVARLACLGDHSWSSWREGREQYWRQCRDCQAVETRDR